MNGLDETIDQEDIQQEVVPEATQEDSAQQAKDDVTFYTREQWLEMGRDPKDWRDPVEFKHKGELIRQKKELKEYFDTQLKQTNMLWEAKLRQEREELLKLRDEAIEYANKDEVKKLDLKLDTNQKQTEMVASQNAAIAPKAKEIEEWESENPWIFNPDDPRTKIANDIAALEIAQGKTIASALRAVDREIAKLEAPKKSSSQLVEGSRVAASKRESMGITWDDLTPAETKVFDSGLFKGDKKAFLKAVQNSRVK